MNKESITLIIDAVKRLRQFSDAMNRCMLDGRITEREHDVLSLRFGLDRHPPRSLEEVGKIYGFTRERVRQIEAKVFEKII